MDHLKRVKSLIAQRIGEYLTPETPRSLYDPMRYVINGGGKLLRPILVVLSCEAVGGEAQQSLDAAAAVEFVHNFTLIHDDIMDQDDTRRGQMTVHKKWDEGVALLAGDGLVAVAYRALLRTETQHVRRVLKAFTESIVEVCEGQALDREFEGQAEVPMVDYLNMISKKTGSLFSLCMEIGAIIGDGDEDDIRKLKEVGDCLGKAFQIQDDLLDITTEETVLGKTFGSDIQQRKITYLIVDAMSRAGKGDQEFICSLMSSSSVTAQDIVGMRELFYRLGAISSATREIGRYLQQADQSLSSLRPTQAKKDLQTLLARIAERKA